VTAPHAVQPLTRPPDATVRVPGSKSLTNRALICAALAKGVSTIDGALLADDTEAMIGCLRALDVDTAVIADGPTVTVTGTGPPAVPGGARLDARLSGTTARFVLPLLAVSRGDATLDGGAPLRGRPMGPTLDALRSLGSAIDELGEPGHLPVLVHGAGLAGGHAEIAADLSSQFVSGLLLSAPPMARGLDLQLTTDAVSQPFLDLTTSVMASFGVPVERVDASRYAVPHTVYRATTYAIEPDASAASYFFAAAAITGGRVRVPGLGRDALQGDAAIVEVLARMGATIERGSDVTEVAGTGSLHGIDVDLGAMPDMAQTIAAVAVFADGPTRVRGVGIIRHHETDRISAVATEMRRAGIDVEEHDDGFTIHPGSPRAAVIETYDDHRMAMSFALLGLRVPGIEIADPECVSKTFPGFFAALDSLR
jgi:3-phosphoshikimate 1-carboxyvinyltransferase